jgi:hypothetical protein
MDQLVQVTGVAGEIAYQMLVMATRSQAQRRVSFRIDLTLSQDQLNGI